MRSLELQREMDRLKAELVRADGRLERFCECGIEHTVGHVRGYLKDKWETVHGCCGCHLDSWPCQEIRGEGEDATT